MKGGIFMFKSSGYRRFLAALLFVAVSIGAGGAFGAQASGDTVGAGLPVSPISTGVLVARAVHAGLIHPRTAASAPSASPQLKCSPAPCVLPNVQASGGIQFSAPVGSALIAINPKNSKQLLTGGYDFTCYNSQGFYTSSNSGATWTPTCLNNLGGFSFGAGGPVVGYDLKGTAYIGGIDYGNVDVGDIVFETSTNNGKTWSAPAIAVKPFLPGGFTDKPWLQIDTNHGSPHANTLYMSVTQFDATFKNTQLTVSHSSDGAATWTTTAVDTIQVFPQVDQFSDIAIGKDGTVYVSWMRCAANGLNGTCGGTTATMEVSKSTDGGNTWSAPVSISSVALAPGICFATYVGFYGCLPNTGDPVSNIPAIGIDNSAGPNAGHLYAVMYTWTGAYMKVQVASSSDGGVTWGAPVAAAPPTATHDQFFPWLSVSPTGVVGVTWLDRRDDPANNNYEAFATYSTNGGSSFATNVKIANAVSNPNGSFLGDFTGNAWAGATLYASWTDTRSGSSQVEVGGLRLRQ